MNGVLGMTALALDTQLTDEQREYISLANTSAQSLLALINQVLDFSKLESGKVGLDLVRFDLHANLSGLVKEFCFTAEQKRLSLTFSVNPEIPRNVTGDWGRLRQVLVNLLGNALKFTHSGRVVLEVVPLENFETAASNVCRVLFSVADSGIGIPQEKLDLIFEAFSQADGSVTREYGGTGLGLTISKQLVKMMGSDLRVQSIVGRGSKFWFAVDLAAGLHQPEAVLAATGNKLLPVETHEFIPRHVLVAEDNPVNQRVVKGLIEKKGHSVTLVNNGLEALEAVRSSRFDLILMDIQMPVMDGLSAASAIRSLEVLRTRARIPILGLTAHASNADRERCLAAGMNGHVAKPFRPNELVELIEQLTRGSRGEPAS